MNSHAGDVPSPEVGMEASAYHIAPYATVTRGKKVERDRSKTPRLSIMVTSP